jgi:hypothetical protein
MLSNADSNCPSLECLSREQGFYMKEPDPVNREGGLLLPSRYGP